MFIRRNIVISCVACTVFINVNAQVLQQTLIGSVSTDSIAALKAYVAPKLSAKFTVKKFIVPALLAGYGAFTLESDGLQSVNKEFQEEIWLEGKKKPMHLDNYLQYAPAISVYVLNIAGVKGLNNLRDRTMIYFISNLFVTGIVSPVKKLSSQLRPDNSSRSSFPSGHTAEAFASAEFMRMEYKHLSPWYGVAGYAMATVTGYLRMYNNKHWFSDVVAGAGIGIASTRLAYWLYPKIKTVFIKNKKSSHTIAMPFYQNKTMGIGLVHSF